MNRMHFAETLVSTYVVPSTTKHIHLQVLPLSNANLELVRPQQKLETAQTTSTTLEALVCDLLTMVKRRYSKDKV